jgi:hypothetical protein
MMATTTAAVQGGRAGERQRVRRELDQYGGRGTGGMMEILEALRECAGLPEQGRHRHNGITGLLLRHDQRTRKLWR